MAIEAVGASVTTIPANSGVTLTPGAGEVWAITHLNHTLRGNASVSLRLAIGRAATGTDPTTDLESGTNPVAPLTPRGPYILTPTNYLSVYAQGSTQGILYTGVKL